jgi:hypothetical protein
MEMNTQTQAKVMEMKTRAQGTRNELQISMNIRAWRNLDGNNNKKRNKKKTPKALIP